MTQQPTTQQPTTQRATAQHPTTPPGDRAYLPAMGHRYLLPLYDAFARVAGARGVQWRLVAQAGIGPHDTVLEIGAGTGAVLLMAKQAVPTATVVGLDPDAGALGVARRLAAEVGLDLDLVVGYADRLPQADGSVDRVLSSFMFHHLPADQKAAALAEAHRVLAPGGSLHLVDIGGARPGLLGRLHPHRDHGGRGGHGPQPEIASAEQVVASLHEAGFAEVTVVGRARTLVGPVTFYRAGIL